MSITICSNSFLGEDNVPVNTNTFADLVKSISAAESIEFDSKEEVEDKSTDFTADQVTTIIKALSVGGAYSGSPDSLTGGDALSKESLEKECSEVDKKKKKKKKLKDLSKDMYKSFMFDVLDKLQVLYPDYSRSEIWASVRTRLETKFIEKD